ncbi:MAG: hypothetical protein SFX19_02835 [Alphaproteobacteria bacterium]|nr:hypothetical protein [Alphaproteobacteria bacterium]
MQQKSVAFFTSYLLFAGIIIALCLNVPALLMDTDTAWHMAAGDLIRASGSLTPPNTWSFTAPEHGWVNVSWLWDMAISALHARFGWAGPLMFNIVTIAMTMVFLYRACLLCSGGSGIASFFPVLLVMMSTVLHLRSMWVSNLFLAFLFMLALFVRYRGWRVWWWYAMPALMPLWVNLHGGFIIAFVLLGAFGLQALLERDWRLMAHLVAVGLLSIAGLLVSPFGMEDILGVVFSMIGKFSFRFTNEFQPSVTDWGFFANQLYIPVFLYYALRYASKPAFAENLLAFGFLLLAFTCIRYWMFFYLFSCPLLAYYIAQNIAENPSRRGVPAFKAWAGRMHDNIFVTHSRHVIVMTSLAWAATFGVLATPLGVRLFGMENIAPYAAYQPGIAFAQKQYPHHRFLNDYGLGAVVLYLSGGGLPVFLDGRVETAYPDKVIRDFHHIWAGQPGWEAVVDSYPIDGVIAYTMFAERELGRLFAQRTGWKEVFRDDHITIFVRQ